MIQPEILITKGMFTRERNITQALVKQNAVDLNEERKTEESEQTEGNEDDELSDRAADEDSR